MDDPASLVALASIILAQLLAIVVITLSRQHPKGNAPSASFCPCPCETVNSDVRVFSAFPGTFYPSAAVIGHHANKCAVKISLPPPATFSTQAVSQRPDLRANLAIVYNRPRHFEKTLLPLYYYRFYESQCGIYSHRRHQVATRTSML